MKFTILLLVYAHILIFANPSFPMSDENTPIPIDDVKGEMKKFSFSQKPVLIKNLLVLTDDNLESNLMKHGHNLILINFWATWCGPCVEEMPSLDKLQSLFETKHLKIITVATGRNNQRKIVDFFKEYKILNLENFRDPKGTLAMKMGVLGLPTSIIISPEGHEIARLIGPINWMQADVVKFFRTLTL